MSKLDGHSTDVTKIGLESVLSYNLGVIEDVGILAVTAPGSGTYTDDPDHALPSSGQNLVLRVNVPIKSAAAIVVSVVGTDQAALPVTGNVTIPAYSPEGQSFDVVPTLSTQRFASVTSVTFTNGVAGDGWTLNVLPLAANDQEICYIENITPSIGETIKPIFCNYELRHNKRLRAENGLSIQGFYVNNYEGLPAINQREVTLREDIKDDGGNSITEVRYYELVRLGVTTDKSADGSDNIRAKAEGSFGRLFIFS